MPTNTKHCITFAGVIGSSKTPIAHHLSWNLGLPILSSDAVRTEVTEDLLKTDQAEYVERRDSRTMTLLATGRSFIYDASVDRVWSNFRDSLAEHGYSWFIISMDLSKELLLRLNQAKNYHKTIERIDSLIEQHQSFLNDYGDQAGLHITDDQFPDRLQLSLRAAEEWLKLAK